MDLREYRSLWDRLGSEDPLWTILSSRGKEGGRWDVEEFFDTGRVEIDRFLAEVASRGLPLRTGAALDFGCGVGRLTQALARRFEHVVGVDLSPVMVEHARRFNRWPDRCEYRVSARPDLSEFAAGSFDFVYSRLVLQHIPPKLTRTYLREFVRVLRPDGVAVFHLPTEPLNPLLRRLPHSALDWTFNASRRIWRRIARPRRGGWEMHWVPRARVEAMIRDAGARVRSVRADDPVDGKLATLDYFVVK